MYQKEAVDQEARIERMKQEGKDEYDIKKQVYTPTAWHKALIPQAHPFPMATSALSLNLGCHSALIVISITKVNYHTNSCLKIVHNSSVYV